MNSSHLNLRQRARNVMAADSTAKFSIEPFNLIMLIDECEAKDIKISLLREEVKVIKSNCKNEVVKWMELLELDHLNKHSDPVIQKEIDREHGNMIRMLKGIIMSIERLK